MEQNGRKGSWIGVELTDAAFRAALAPAASQPDDWARLEVHSFDNNADGVLTLTAWIENCEETCLGICVEANGALSERFARMVASAGGLQTAIVDAEQAQTYAKSIRMHDRTGRHAAAVLALYGLFHKPAFREIRSKIPHRLRELSQLREDYMEMRRQNQQRLEQAKDPMARLVLRMTVRQLTGAIDQIETAMRR